MTHYEVALLDYLLNALWQVPAIFLVASLAARLTRSAGPHIEHRIWVATLLLEAALPACAFAPSLRGFFLSFIHSNRGNVSTQVTVLGVSAIQNQSRIGPIIALVALIASAAIFIYLSARLLYRLHRTHALRFAARPVTLTGEPLALWQRCARIFDVHNAQLATSTAVSAPSTIGIIRRVVLLPPALLVELPHEDLAAALAHEFAHMRRRDFARNLLYEVVALPIAWHPLLWLTRLRIAESREMICDELAAEATHGTTRYAHSLLRLAASFSRPAPAATLHAIGILDANALERRVMKLTGNHPTAAPRRTAIVAAILLGAATCATAMSLRLEVPVSALLSTGTAVPAHALIASGAPQSDRPVRVAAGVVAGQLISKVNPVYPPEAREKGIQGAVVLHAIIGKDGTIRQLAVLSGPMELAPSAMDAVKQWVYQPYLLNGDPTEVETTITVNYSLANSPEQQPNQPPIAIRTAGPDIPQSARGSDAGVNTVGGSVHSPVLISAPDPEYTESARKAKLSGNVVVGLIVDSSGQPQNVHVTRGLGNELDKKAIEAVQQYRFKPATKDGEPVAVALNVEVNFRIF